MSSLTVGYALDRGLQEAANAEDENYWYAYVEEILSRLGVCARCIDLAACADSEALAEVGVLVLGDFPASSLPAGSGRTLTEWVAAGGVLIGFATAGLDDLFGVEPDEGIAQDGGPFSISGYLELGRSPITQDCRAEIAPEQRLIIISPIRVLRGAGSDELARLFLCDPDDHCDGARARDAQSPAIVHRTLEAGHAFYFAFNVCQTMWAIQQGRPVDADHDGDGYLRISDACAIGANSRAVPYTDALHFLLANMIGRRSVPMIHQVPPRDGRVAPALLYFGGDDEAVPGNQVPASDFMAQRGLPYHINAMFREGSFAISPEEEAHIEANGHEIALHYNFMDGFDHPCGFTREDVAHQAQLFRERFGRDSVCSVPHCCRWTGWAEPARWMRECGGRANNCYIGWTSPPSNPVNTLGFAFGSAFPRYFWDDAEHGNARIDFLELPIPAYEVGYQQEEFFPEKIRAALDLAVRYRLTFNFFYHPVYIAQYPACRKAIDELVRLMEEMETPPVLMGPDEVWRWWDARSKASIVNAQETGDRVRLEAECEYDRGFVVKIPTGDAPAGACVVDGLSAPFESAHEFGQHWAFVPLAQGQHVLEVKLGAGPPAKGCSSRSAWT